MEKEIIFIVEDSPKGGFEARAMGHSVFTEADTFEGLRKMVRDAVVCHFDEPERPSAIRLYMVKEEVLRL
jgi:hypothetical protein